MRSHSHRSAELGYLFFRLGVAFLFLFHAPQKWLGWYGGPQWPFLSIRSLASLIEAVCSPLIALGLFTSYAAFFAACEMVGAYFIVHWNIAPDVVRGIHLPGLYWPIENRGELSVLYFVVFVYILLKGGGLYSLDSRRQRQRRAAAEKEAERARSAAVAPVAGSRKAV